MQDVAGSYPRYRDPYQPVEARVDDLLARMTLEEKVAQLGSVWVFEVAPGGRFSEELAGRRLAHGMGQITRIGGASDADARAIAALANVLQRYLVERTRLGIPAIVHEECCAGLMARGATVFPQIIGLASTWEPRLARAMAARIRRQMRAVGAHQGLAPVLDVARDPRWGRIEETFGEDPYLASVMGIAYVQGLQGDDLREGVVATGKHFVAYGVPEGGLNWAPAHVGRRELLEVFLPPFEAAVREARLRSIMPGYHEIDGVPVSADPELLTGVLREQWGFDGIVVSDYTAIDNLRGYHRVATDKAEAAAQALLAGIDVELPSVDCYGEALLDAVRRGRVPVQAVDAAVRRVLTVKFTLGLFDHPYVDEERAAATFDMPEDRALAREIARRSVVLLKNEGGLLPLPRDIGRLAVIGPAAHSRRLLNGDYHYPAHVDVYRQMVMVPGEQPPFMPPMPPPGADLEQWEAEAYPRHFTPFATILEGIRARVGPRSQVTYARGCDVTDPSTEGFAAAVQAAREADVAVVVVGHKSGLTRDCTCGEFRDAAELSLPGVQAQLVWEVLRTGTPTVVVLVGGRPVALGDIARTAPAVMAAWIPGEEGGHAVAEVLLGEAEPGGRLPVSIPRKAGQIPVFYGHKPTGGRSQVLGDYVDVEAGPLYPFGHGLTYTTFRYDRLVIVPEAVPADGQVEVACRVTNVGERAGDEVVQLYVRDVQASVTRPVKELKGFVRLHLRPGESREVRFTLDLCQLAFYDRKWRRVVEPGEVEVMIGASSQDIRLTGRFVITGDPIVTERKVFITPVTVT